MKKQFNRTERIAELIQRKLSQLIYCEINDPNFPKLVTLTGVIVSSDLSYAKIYFTSISTESHAQIELRLNKVAGYLRSGLARTMTVRKLPKLHFFYDESINDGIQLSKLIDIANKAV